MKFSDLDYFADTMTNIAAYMFAAPGKHNRLIYNDPEDSLNDSRSAVKTRVTQHYTSALLAYGVPPSEPELVRATDWFATPFPESSHAMIDSIEMTRLEGLLSLRPNDATVAPRLQQLLKQKSKHFFEIDRTDAQGPPAPVFDTIWSLKVLSMARQGGVLNDYISDHEIQECIDYIAEIITEDKDLSLLLRLQFDLTGEIREEQRRYVQRLAAKAEQHHYIWGVSAPGRWEKIKDLVDSMQRNHLTAGLIEDSAKHFREAILSTCYVIENLAGITRAIPEIEPALEASMKLWWNQFSGPGAPNVLRTYFQDEYDFLMVICRTMVAVREYVGQAPGALCWVPSLRDTSRKFSTNEWPELESIDQALRGWIDIEIHNPKRLKLGLSGADVIRIRPSMYKPTDEARNDLLRESLVVKYGPVDEIEMERYNYRELPPRIRDSFVRIPEDSYVNNQKQAFVIMQDLSDYRTLYEIYDKLLIPERPRVVRMLIDFLLSMHQGDNDGLRPSSNTHLRDLYIMPMLRHVDHILIFAERAQARDAISEADRDRFVQVEGLFNDMLGSMMQKQRQIRHFPLAYMHGDLHSRNVMIYRIPKNQTKNGRTELRFKLIDLESLRADGDAAHDAGQLIIDLDLLRIAGKKSLSRNVIENLVYFQEQIKTRYQAFAESREDETFLLRLELAKARAMLRIAKSFAKRSDKALHSREVQQGVEYITESLHLAEGAAAYLKNVHDDIS